LPVTLIPYLMQCPICKQQRSLNHFTAAQAKAIRNGHGCSSGGRDVCKEWWSMGPTCSDFVGIYNGPTNPQSSRRSDHCKCNSLGRDILHNDAMASARPYNNYVLPRHPAIDVTIATRSSVRGGQVTSSASLRLTYLPLLLDGDPGEHGALLCTL
jgi:hypothetical protein